MKRFRSIAVLALVAAGSAALAGTAAAQSGDGAKTNPTASDVGITPTEIRIGVIADTGSALAPGLFQGSVEGVEAWAKYMNEKEGGLAGRKIVVDAYDSGLDANKARNSIIEACERDFAIVGTSALFVLNADDLIGCKDVKGNATGLPDFPVVTTEEAHQCSPVSFPVNPPILDCATADQNPQTYRGSLNSAVYLMKKYGKKALHGLYLYPSDLKAAKASWIPQYAARQDAGIEEDATFDVSARAPQAAYTPFVQAMKDDGSTYATQGGSANVMVSLMKEAKLQGLTTVKAWDCALQCYDKAVLDAPETEGLYVSTLFLPFGETKSNPMLKSFMKYVGADDADGFAIQSWSAGLVFRDAVNEAVARDGINGVTRTAVLDAVKGITEFDADGMLATTNIGEKVPTRCVVVNQVRGGRFVRLWPEKKGTFDCNDTNDFAIRMNVD